MRRNHKRKLLAAAVIAAIGSLAGNAVQASEDWYFLHYNAGGKGKAYQAGATTPLVSNLTYGVRGYFATAPGSFVVRSARVDDWWLDASSSTHYGLWDVLADPKIGPWLFPTDPDFNDKSANQLIDPLTTVDASNATGFGALFVPNSDPGNSFAPTNGVGFNLYDSSNARIGQGQLYGPEGDWFQNPGLNLLDASGNVILSNTGNYNVVPPISSDMADAAKDFEYFYPAVTTTYTGTSGTYSGPVTPTLSATNQYPSLPANCPVDFYIIGANAGLVALKQLFTDSSGNVSGTGPTLSDPDTYSISSLVSYNVLGLQTRDASGDPVYVDDPRLSLSAGTSDDSGNVNFQDGIGLPSASGATFATNPSTLRACGQTYGVSTGVVTIASRVDGACGTANGSTVTTAPTSNLCSAGTAGSVTSGTTAYTWSCAGSNGGANDSCSATRNYPISTSVTGSGSIDPTSKNVAYNATQTFTVTPATGYTLTSISGCGGSRSGSTYTTGSTTAACTVTAVFSANGACGTASGQTYTVAPSANLCSAGTPGIVTPGKSSYAWNCAGSDGAATASCSATRNYVIDTSVVGPGSISPASQNAAYYAVRTFRLTPSPGYLVGTVTGCGGKLAGSTYTTGKITGNCTVTAKFGTYNEAEGEGTLNGKSAGEFKLHAEIEFGQPVIEDVSFVSKYDKIDLSVPKSAKGTVTFDGTAMTATVSGTGVLKGVGNVDYVVSVKDGGDNGKNDSFRLKITTAGHLYDTGVQTLKKGDLHLLYEPEH